MTAPSSGPRLPSPDYSFAQGIVEAWDAIAGTNTVRVRGKALNNLLSLVGSETGLIRVGDSVIVGRIQNTYAVFGRIEPPGIEQRAFGIVTDREDTNVDWSTDTGATFITYAGGPQVSVHIASSRRCRVDLTAFLSAYNGAILAGFTVSGASTIAADYRKALWFGCDQVSGDDPVQPYMSATRTVWLSAADGLVEGDNVFTMVYRQGLNAAGGGGSVAYREIAVQPF